VVAAGLKFELAGTRGQRRAMALHPDTGSRMFGRNGQRERERERDGVAAAAAVTGDGSCRVSNDPDHHRPHLKKTLSVLLYIHTYHATCI
jgi:hypothetical protein